MRPLIGVTGPDRGGTALWVFTALILLWFGARPARITPKRPKAAAELDALVLGGGADVAPSLYGEVMLSSPGTAWMKRRFWEALLDLLLFPLAWIARSVSASADAAPIDQARDNLELALLDDSLSRGLPILGICRGAQLLNVFFGGTLHQELSSFYTEVPEVRTVLPRKEVQFEKGTILQRILGPDACWVNALHRQAVNQLGDGVRVAARDLNGIVQAVEHGGYRFVVGVQWHPEMLPQSGRQRRLFAELVSQASYCAFRRSAA